MEYTILGILLMILMLLYFKVADKFNIIDKPNQRSSHTEITLRGGGIIFWFSALLYFAQHVRENYFFFIGITLVSLVSFWDDIQSLSNKIRMSVQFLAITLIFFEIGVFNLSFLITGKKQNVLQEMLVVLLLHFGSFIWF